MIRSGTTKGPGKGSGLGLSMVYGFVKQSRGHVTIDSEQGQGTTVRIYMPRSEATAEELPHAEPTQISVAQGETILVVEDDPEVCKLVVALLRNLGYETLEAPDAESALKVLETPSRISMLFTDVILPNNMNGLELAVEFRRRRPEIGILYTSGYTAEAVIHQGELDEGLDLLKKPYARADLARRVRAVLDKTKEQLSP